jgi:hypothetical protein
MGAGHNITLPEGLLAEVRSVATAEHRSAEELVQEAVELHLRHKRLEAVYARGERRAREAGIHETQVDAIVKDERRARAKLAR